MVGSVFVVEDKESFSHPDKNIGKLPNGKYVVEGGHAWNRIKLNGVWYMSDITQSIVDIQRKQAPKLFLFSESLARKMGIKSINDDLPKCETDYPKENVAKLFKNYYSSYLLWASTAKLYGLSKKFQEFTGVPLDKEDYIVGNPIRAIGSTLTTLTIRMATAGKSFLNGEYTFSDSISRVRQRIMARLGKVPGVSKIASGIKNMLPGAKRRKLIDGAQALDKKSHQENESNNRDDNSNPYDNTSANGNTNSKGDTNSKGNIDSKWNTNSNGTRTDFEKKYVGTLVGEVGINENNGGKSTGTESRNIPGNTIGEERSE